METIESHKIEPTQIEDLDIIYELYDHAMQYQREKGFPVWHGFDRNVLVRDIENKNHYKICINSGIAMVFSLCYADPIIWRHMDKGDAVYLHRIAVNPAFKGRKLFSSIVDWTRSHARQRGHKYIRMDTWADNETLAGYYKSFGFKSVEHFNTPDSTELPSQNRNLALVLLEMEL
jgi:ribosomal protein S18 acetylase RimI-like enzyme